MVLPRLVSKKALKGRSNEVERSTLDVLAIKKRPHLAPMMLPLVLMSLKL